MAKKKELHNNSAEKEASLTWNSIRIKLEMSRKEINCSFAYACIFHAFSTCSVRHFPHVAFPSVLLHDDPNIYLFAFPPASARKSKPFRRPSIPFPFHAIFQPDRSFGGIFTISRFCSFLLFGFTFFSTVFSLLFGLFGFCLSFDFCWFCRAPQRGNCILPLLTRLALGQFGHQLCQIE